MYEMTGPHVSSVPVPACAGRRRTRTNRRPWARAQKQTHCPVGPPSHRSPEGNLRAVWSRAVLHLATRRPPGFARPAEPSSTGRSEDPPAASGSPNRLPPGDPRVVWLRAVRWSRSWPSGPKTARPVRTPGVTRHPVIRRSPGLVPLHRHTGPGHPQGCPQPVHRWRSSTANPKVCDGFPPGNRNPDGPKASRFTRPHHPLRTPPASPGFPGLAAPPVALRSWCSALRWTISTAPENPAQGLTEKKFKIFPAVHRQGLVIPRKGSVVHPFTHKLSTNLWTTRPPPSTTRGKRAI